MRHMRTKGFAAAMLLCSSLAVATPITAFAHTGSEAECICEEKCTEDTVNDQCPVCKADYTQCQGIESEETETEDAEEMTDTEETEEAMGPLTPDGNMTLVDDYGSSTGAGKQFITITTKNGNYFYLIIDRDDSGNETVHFLNLVDESDLLSLMDEDEQKAYAESLADDDEKEEVVVEEEPVTEEPEEETETKKKGPNAGLLILLLACVGGGIGFYFYKQTKGKEPVKTVQDPDIDYSENDDEEDYLETMSEQELLDEADAKDEENADDEE